jgi:hypothetical protein
MRASRAELALLWSLLVGVDACGASRPPLAPPPEPVEAAPAASPAASEPGPIEQKPEVAATPAAPQAGSSLDHIMREHFADALLIRQAVIAGAPENAAAPASALATAGDLEHLPEGWRGFVERMQEVAGRIRDSSLISRAARATADLGVTCGLCHQQRGGPHASSEPAPAQGATLESRMQRHAWATERLWEGLYVPSDDAWAAGARALSSAPFPTEVTKPGGVYARTAAADFARLVRSAPTKKTPLDRAELYAQLLLTCGSCHRALHAAP